MLCCDSIARLICGMLRHFPQWSWCAAGSLCNNVEHLRIERGTYTPEAENFDFFKIWFKKICPALLNNNIFCPALYHGKLNILMINEWKMMNNSLFRWWCRTQWHAYRFVFGWILIHMRGMYSTDPTPKIDSQNKQFLQ